MNRDEIKQWLKKYDITNYTIWKNLVVDVHGSVYLYDKKLTELPFQFGTVTGYFNCSNNSLTSLQYCPTSVGEGFVCSENQLTSLRYCSTSVGGSFLCYNNQLTSLQYCPTSIGGHFDCSSNQLTSLQYCPTTVGGSFYCSNKSFIVTEENENHWIETIKNHKKIYSYIKEPTESLTSFYKMMWEV